MDEPRRALEDFRSKWSCAQSVFGAFAPRFGIEPKTARIVASAFGGGLGHTGGTCGAAAGACMALGFFASEREPDLHALQNVSYELAAEFLRRFHERFGTTLCRNLIEHDISTPEGLQAARDAKVFQTRCETYVQEAARIVVEMTRG